MNEAPRSFHLPSGIVRNHPTRTASNRLLTIIVRCLLGLTAFASLSAQSARSVEMQKPTPPTGVLELVNFGTIGRYPIIMAMTVRDYKYVIAAHYFYKRSLQSIKLTVSGDNRDLQLTESGGGTFHLHLSGNPTDPDPNLYSSNVWVGSWTKGTTIYPVSIAVGVNNKECSFYPDPPEPKSPSGAPHLRQTACHDYPDQVEIDKCLIHPFESAAATAACYSKAESPCGLMAQQDMNFCVGAIRDYLTSYLEWGIHDGKLNSRIFTGSYSDWLRKETKYCRRDSDVDPDGSGYNSDIDGCLSIEAMKAAQKYAKTH